MTGLLRNTALAVAAALVLAVPAHAYEYRVPILIQDEDDLNELYFSKDITEEERDRLVILYRDPLDPNTADRDELYDLPGLTYAMVDAIIDRRDDKPFTRISQLKKVAGITPEIYTQLNSFIRIVPRAKKGDREKLHGKITVKAIDRISDSDDDYPEGYIRAQAKSKDRKYQFGAAVVGLNSVWTPTYKTAPKTYWNFSQDGDPKYLGDGVTPDTDTADRYLLTDGEALLPSWPKVYAMVQSGKVQAIAGSYRVGFGQRIVLDNSGRSNPHGFKPDLEIYEGESGFGISKGFFGAAGTYTDIKVGKLDMDATAFFSWWRYDQNQYRLKHKVEGVGGDELESYTVLTPYKTVQGVKYHRKLSHVTLPSAYSETIGGGNVTLNLDSKSRIGLTGYVAKTGFHLDDPDTVFARHEKFPERDLFYAAGADFAWAYRDFQLFGEAGMMDNSSYAGTVRGIAELGDVILETSYRYLPYDFDNPHSRAYSMSDQFEGDTDKGEQGVMFTAKYRVAKWLTLRIDEDIWQATRWADDDEKEVFGDKEKPWRMETYLRVEIKPTSKLRIGTFVQFNDKDLSESSRDESYSDTYGAGEKYQWGLQLANRFTKNTALWAYYKLGFEDAALGDAYQKRHYGTLKFTTRPLKLMDFAIRAKYLKGELEELQGTTREHFMEGYVQVGLHFNKEWKLALRGMLRQDILESDPETDESLSFSDGLSEGDTEIFWKAMLDYKF